MAVMVKFERDRVEGDGFMQLLYGLRGAVWLLVYLLFILAPLFALLAGSHPRRAIFGRSFRSLSAIPALR